MASSREVEKPVPPHDTQARRLGSLPDVVFERRLLQEERLFMLTLLGALCVLDGKATQAGDFVCVHVPESSQDAGVPGFDLCEDLPDPGIRRPLLEDEVLGVLPVKPEWMGEHALGDKNGRAVFADKRVGVLQLGSEGFDLRTGLARAEDERDVLLLKKRKGRPGRLE